MRTMVGSRRVALWILGAVLTAPGLASAGLFGTGVHGDGIPDLYLGWNPVTHRAANEIWIDTDGLKFGDKNGYIDAIVLEFMTLDVFNPAGFSAAPPATYATYTKRLLLRAAYAGMPDGPSPIGPPDPDFAPDAPGTVVRLGGAVWPALLAPWGNPTKAQADSLLADVAVRGIRQGFYNPACFDPTEERWFAPPRSQGQLGLILNLSDAGVIEPIDDLFYDLGAPGENSLLEIYPRLTTDPSGQTRYLWTLDTDAPGATIDPDTGRIIWQGDGGQRGRVYRFSATLTEINTPGQFSHVEEFTVTVVPEPATALILLSGALAAGLVVRRR